MPETLQWGIDIATLTEADRFQVFEFRDPETGETALVDLRNWNDSFCFCSWPGTNCGGPTIPKNLRRLGPSRQPLAFYVVYHNPTDHPGKWVVRRQRLFGNQIIADCRARVVADSLDEARPFIPVGLTNIGRLAQDDLAIHEVWI